MVYRGGREAREVATASLQVRGKGGLSRVRKMGKDDVIIIYFGDGTLLDFQIEWVVKIREKKKVKGAL